MIPERTLTLLGFTEIRNKLISHTTCALSQKMAENLVPEIDIDAIETLLAETEDAVQFITRRGSPPSAGVADLTGTLRHAGAGGTLSLSELLKVSGMLCACRRMRQYCTTASEDSEIQNRIIDYIQHLSDNQKLEETISKCILSETEIADDASPELWEIRRKILQTQNVIKNRLEDMIHASKYAKILQDGVVTVRGDRYCVPVKVDSKSEIPGIVHDTSSSGQTLFIEPVFVVEGNNKIRELKIAEKEEIERILADLSGQIALREDILLNDLRTISYLDFLFAKAKLALDMHGIRPVVSLDKQISIVRGRNPLIDAQKVVPITVQMGFKEEGHAVPVSALIITGPNTGGKTVTLKTVGLLTVMMQCGLMIPCQEKSKLSVYTGIYADIGDEQSIAQNLSTFSAHMKNITSIIDACDESSLILFDELGAGTDPTEGAALAMSILECVHQMGATVLATTHYSELKIFASTTPGFVNASCEFDVNTLRPTYKLLIGVPGKSNAFAISEKLGLDPLIIERAREFLTNEDLRFEEMLTGIERSRSQIELQQEETKRLAEETKRLYDEIELERENLRQERNALLDKTREKAREITNKARISADRLLTDIRRAAIQANHDAVREAESAKSLFEREVETSLNEITKGYRVHEEKAQPPRSLSVGEEVRILSLGCNAIVLSLPDSDGQVHLQAGMMKLYCPLSDLKVLQKASTSHEKNARKDTAKGVGSLMKAAVIKHELDVRGMTVDEAVSLIDRQIHDGILAKQGTFTVIHGKGTGALRKGIHDFLKRSSYVKEYRLGTFGEGDSGVTIVTLA